MIRFLRLVFCWSLVCAVLLPVAPGFCDARGDAAKKALLDTLHKQARFLLETSVIGYTQIRHTPAADIFFLTDLAGNSYFLYPTSAISPELKAMLRESYKEGKFVKLNGLVATWDDKGQQQEKTKESGFFVDAATTYEWADPSYAEMYEKLEQGKQKQELARLNAIKKAEAEAAAKKNDPQHVKDLDKKAKELRKKKEKEQKQGNTPPGASPPPTPGASPPPPPEQ